MDNATRSLIVNWIVAGIALLGIGPIAGAAAAVMRSPEGSADTTALLSSAPVTGIVMAAIGLALAGIWGLIVKPLAGARMALACSGMVLLWSARKFGRPDVMIREAAESGTMFKLALEGAVVGLGVVVIAMLITRKPDLTSKSGHPAGGRSHTKPDIKAIALGTVVMIAVGGLVAMIVARTGQYGQTVAAAIAAGVAGAAAARTVSHVAPTWAFFAGGAILAGVGPIIANQLAGAGLREALYVGELFPLAHLSPFDWAAGLLIGVPMGDAWADSMVERHEPHVAGSQARA